MGRVCTHHQRRILGISVACDGSGHGNMGSGHILALRFGPIDLVADFSRDRQATVRGWLAGGMLSWLKTLMSVGQSKECT